MTAEEEGAAAQACETVMEEGEALTTGDGNESTDSELEGSAADEEAEVSRGVSDTGIRL